jgi:23S rRNA pseudouridine2605 synthase
MVDKTRTPGRSRAILPDRVGRDPGEQSREDGERVAKVLARLGFCSRREAEGWIEAGRVALNGRVLNSPAINVRPGDRLSVDGTPVPLKERTRLWLYHKPKGLVTTHYDPEGRATVFARLPPDMPRVISVGRLDINTEGLLLLTNDGGLARVLELPSTGWLRRYRVRVHGTVTQAQLDSLERGLTLDGISYGPVRATLDRAQGSNAWLTMDLREGKNREIKRVLAHLGLEVARLIRVSFGPFQLGSLAEGAVEEVKTRHLKEQLGTRLARLAQVDFDAPTRETASSARARPKIRPEGSEGRTTRPPRPLEREGPNALKIERVKPEPETRRMKPRNNRSRRGPGADRRRPV